MALGWDGSHTEEGQGTPTGQGTCRHRDTGVNRVHRAQLLLENRAWLDTGWAASGSRGLRPSAVLQSVGGLRGRAHPADWKAGVIAFWC